MSSSSLASLLKMFSPDIIYSIFSMADDIVMEESNSFLSKLDQLEISNIEYNLVKQLVLNLSELPRLDYYTLKQEFRSSKGRL